MTLQERLELAEKLGKMIHSTCQAYIEIYQEREENKQKQNSEKWINLNYEILDYVVNLIENAEKTFQKS